MATWAWLVPAASATQPPAPTELIELGEAELQTAGQPPQRIALPYRVYRPQRVFASYRMEMRFDAPAALLSTRAMLALDSWPDGGRITLNGAEVVDLATSTETRVVRYLRPFAFNLPPGALRERGNLLSIEWGSRETLVLVPRPYIGARTRLEPLIERKLFWEHTLVPASTIFALIVGLTAGAIWWQLRNRQLRPDYLLLSLSALGWVVFNTMLLWSPMPASWFVWRRAIGIVGVGVFALGMWVSLTRLAGRPSQRFERLCLGWVALGPVLLIGGFVLTGASHLPRAEALWSVGAALLGSVPLWALLQQARQQPGARAMTLLGFVLIGLALTVREALVYVVRDPVGTVHLGLQLLAPLWLVTASGLLVQDFVASLRLASQQRAEVDRQLAEREAELARLHARERGLATLEERQRIMQDMHDGLGSQLVSSLALAERGVISAAQTAELLRACIDDLRLAIDTLTEADVDLALTAGNLRFRMEPRLRAAGLRVRWDMQGLPDALCLPGTTALPVLRVLQEALANAVKHAGAQAIQVRLTADAHALLLEIADDGRGFDLHGHAPGKGLASMHKRARALGASLHVESGAQGTQVSLRVPLPA